MSGSHSSGYGREMPYIGSRSDGVPQTDDLRNERRENNPENLVTRIHSKVSDLKTRFVDRGAVDKTETKSKGWAAEPSYAQPSQPGSSQQIAELPAIDMVIREAQNISLAYTPPAELEGDNSRPNCARGPIAGSLADESPYLDFEDNSSTVAEANLAFTHSREPIPELPSSPVYRRPLPVPLDRVGDSTESFTQEAGTDPTNELTRIQHEVRQAIIRFPKLRGPESTDPRFETTASSISRIFTEYRRLLESNNRTKRDYSDNFLRVQDDLRAVNTKLQDQLEARKRELEGQKSRHGRETEALRRDISILKSEKKELESSRGNKLRKEKRYLQNEIENLKSKLRITQGNAESDRHELGKRLDKARKIIDDNKAIFHKNSIVWEQDRIKLEQAYSDLQMHLQRMEHDEQHRLDAVEDKWEGKLAQERREHEESSRTLRYEFNQLKTEQGRERSKHKEDLRKQEEVLMRRYEAEKEEYENVIEDFKSSSARREHFKGMTDGQAAAQFKRLANSIDDFSRIEWEHTKEESWPITDDDMRKLARNTRKLKQHIIQNTLWLLLYDSIFQSPFKILGSYAEKDDTEWIPIYSSGASSYEWPDVSSEVERNRFETAKAAMNALEPSASHSALKSSFETFMVDTMNVICPTLLKVAKLQEKDRKRLENIILLAGRVWLESCSQRYRLIVVLPHGSGDILSYAASDRETLQLVVRPELKRYGDSQGKGLMRGEPLASWKAQIETYPQ